jgi:hypothetical protein
MPCHALLPGIDHSNCTWQSVQVMKFLIMQFSLTSYSVTPLRSKYLLCNVLSWTLSLCSSLNISDQVSHPYKTTGKIKLFFLCNLLCIYDIMVFGAVLLFARYLMKSDWMHRIIMCLHFVTVENEWHWKCPVLQISLQHNCTLHFMLVTGSSDCWLS